ncbi:hypothetical protein ABK040_002645 [Willaertia magna]
MPFQRLSPIDRSKRTAKNGSVVGAENIIKGKRRRRKPTKFDADNNNNGSSSCDITENSESGSEEIERELRFESSSEEEEIIEEKNNCPLVIQLNKKKKFEEEEISLSDEEKIIKNNEKGKRIKVLKEAKDYKEKKKEKKQTKNNVKKVENKKIKIEDNKTKKVEKVEEVNEEKKEDESIFLPLTPFDLMPFHNQIPLQPSDYFCKEILKEIERLGGKFPEFYNPDEKFKYITFVERYSHEVKIFSKIKWSNKKFKSKICPFIKGLEFDIFDIEEVDRFDFLKNNRKKIVLIGDALDCILGTDIFFVRPIKDGNFDVFIMIDSQKHEKPLKIKLLTLLKSLVVDPTVYNETDEIRPDFTQ